MGCTSTQSLLHVTDTGCVALPTDEKQPWPGCKIPASALVYPVSKGLATHNSSYSGSHD